MTAALMSETEIDYHIHLSIKEDLDAVGKRAKGALTRAKTETKTIASNRNSS
jgi:hypothetical protein